ncbi:hypothetical protein C8R44DRAFT_220288 [Mycena epipterygia]|nr:hypothetical protein C8R44DRAFT_220288 [Mycena epipterygia]
MNLKILTLLGLLCFFADIIPSLGKETNASRLRRGLPPLPPRFLSRNKGATASMTVSSRPSSTPRPRSSVRSGRIQVFAANGSSLGYVRNSTPMHAFIPLPQSRLIHLIFRNGINLEADSAHDLRVEIAGEAPFDIIITNPNFPAPFYLGALSSRNLALHDLTTIVLSNVDQARGAAASRKGFVQSSIWSINSSKELEARYVNPDGTKSPLLIAFDAHENELHFVGDIDFYNSANPDFPASAVKFYLSED